VNHPWPATFLIGELSARSGRSIHTIRWYEAQGLIPGVVRDSGGRRNYTEQHVDWLDLMDRLRRTGMSVAEMRDYASLVKLGRKHAQAAPGAAGGPPREGQGDDCRDVAGAQADRQQDRLLRRVVAHGQRPKLIPSLRKVAPRGA
jgi:DNA-binding transcriptional MerR regulator